MNFEDHTLNETIVAQVDNPDEEFSGLYGYHYVFDEAAFLKDTHEFILPSFNQGRQILTKINIDTKKLVVLEGPKTDNNILLKIIKDLIFVKMNSVSEPDSIWLVKDENWTKIAEVGLAKEGEEGSVSHHVAESVGGLRQDVI